MADCRELTDSGFGPVREVGIAISELLGEVELEPLGERGAPLCRGAVEREALEHLLGRAQVALAIPASLGLAAFERRAAANRDEHVLESVRRGWCEWTSPVATVSTPRCSARSRRRPSRRVSPRSNGRWSSTKKRSRPKESARRAAAFGSRSRDRDARSRRGRRAPHSARRRARAIPRVEGRDVPRPSGVGARSRVAAKARQRLAYPRRDSTSNVMCAPPSSVISVPVIARTPNAFAACANSSEHRRRRDREQGPGSPSSAARRELLRLRRPIQEGVRGMAVQLDVARHLVCGMVEIGAGEVIFQSGKLDVTLLADLEQLAAVARTRSRLGDDAASRARPTRRGAVRLRRRARAPARGSRASSRPAELGIRSPRVVHTAEVTGDTRRGTSSCTPPARATATMSAETSRPSTSGRPRTPCRPIPRSSSSAGQEAWRATRSPTGPTGARPCSSRRTRSRSPSSSTGAASGERRCTSTVSTQTPRPRGGVHVPPPGCFARAPGGTLVVFPPGVVHGFDNDSDASARCFNFHMPSLGFADYMRGRNPTFDQHDRPRTAASTAAVVVARLPE